MSKNSRIYWELRFNVTEVDDTSAALMELGAAGTVSTSPEALTCYLSATKQELEQFVTAVKHELNLTPHATIEAPTHNWVQECEEIWQPLQVGAIKLRPVMSVEQAQQIVPETNELLLVPGAGFGTGHHATTAMVMELLQSGDLKQLNPSTLADIGTGSGVLALLATRLFKAKVAACDIDGDALNNACDNILLNAAQGKITLIQSSIEAIQGTFDIVTANLYGDLLLRFAAPLNALVRPGGYLLLSGFDIANADRVLNHYSTLAPQGSDGFSLVQKLFQDGWVAAMFKKHAS